MNEKQSTISPRVRVLRAKAGLSLVINTQKNRELMTRKSLTLLLYVDTKHSTMSGNKAQKLSKTP